MGLRDINIRSTYKSGVSDANPIDDFLIPCLGQSVRYDRLSGYFSSRIFSLAADGLAEFLTGDGKMRLLMSEKVTKEDFEALANHYETDSGNERLNFSDFLDDLPKLASEIERAHFDAMCWLLRQGRLEVRVVAYVQDEASTGPIFHPKVGVFTDSSGDSISFSGSVNETAAGWTGNIEEFKVFRSWEDGTRDFVKSDQANFEFFWDGGASPDFATLPLPDALKAKILELAPEDVPNLKRLKRNVIEKTPSWGFRDYQIQAIESWFQHGRRGIFSMATGTGKTKTARGCITRLLETKQCLVVVSAPYQHIARQWQVELAGFKPLYVPTNGWQEKLTLALQEKTLGWHDSIVVVGVQNTLASSNFASFLNEAEALFDEILFVGDEAHGLGASAFRSALNPIYTSRLGLSATPTRYFDEIGTKVLLDFFKPETGVSVEDSTIFEFDTTKALAWRDPITGQRALCDYEYHARIVKLTPAEQEAYDGFTAQIGKFQGRDLSPEEQGILENYLFQRAAVIKTASAKISLLRDLLTRDIENLNNTLIYCYDNDQLSEVARVLFELGITYRRFTGEEGTKEEAEFGGLSERDYILKNFGLGLTGVLLAIKCLDEGVDVPRAERAYILASSGNPREFIQRRGRLLRPHAEKPFARIFDILVEFDAVSDPSNLTASNEIARLIGLAQDALNRDEIFNEFTEFLGKELQ